MDGWNMCDSWPGDCYDVLITDGAIRVTQIVAEYFDDAEDYRGDDAVVYMARGDAAGNCNVYWKKRGE